MRSLFSGPICPSCLFTARTRIILQQTARPSGVAQKFFYRERAAPSRMVLSDRVASSPRRDARDRDNDTSPRRTTAGPFGGMNQTSAGIRRGATRPTRAPGRAVERRGSQVKPETENRRIKAMKMKGSLARVPERSRSQKPDPDRFVSFNEFNLLPEVKTALYEDVLDNMAYVHCSPIQKIAIPALLAQVQSPKATKREEYLIAAETGSGKTLAYLCPVITALKTQEKNDPLIIEYNKYFKEQTDAINTPGYTGPVLFDPHPTMARPRVIILVPTSELVEQVGAVARALSHTVKFKVSRLSANISAKAIRTSMYSPAGVDLVVSTPHLLASMADSDPNILSRVTHLVIDEADSLFDRSFQPVTTSIMDRALPSLKQLILCSATIPKKLETYVRTEFPDMVELVTPQLHAIPRRVQLGVIDAAKDPYRDNKKLACADAIWTIGKDKIGQDASGGSEVKTKHIMVFVNEREDAQDVADYLVTKGINAISLHRDTENRQQSEMLKEFTASGPKSQEPPRPAPAKGVRVLPNTKVIVATDLASRGIDTLAVRYVILYDVPHTTIDFIHRLGRAGRMSKRGRGIVLVGRKDRRDLVAEVRESMYMGQPLL
ncbi:ATP-dependent RNA helicase mrh-4 [Whalleya microplaca]|nr:ATP-dependent RNA helicase mrh-4 [Whalleya microplaca]